MSLKVKSLCWGISLFFASTINAEEQNYLTFGLSQTQTDYFGNGVSPIKPDSQLLGYSRQINDNWLFDLSYEKTSGEGRWLNRDGVLLDIYDQAETKSKTIGLAISWQTEEYSLDLSYAIVETDDRSISFIPRILESVTSDDSVSSFSYNRSVNFDSDAVSQWSLDWTVGAQYAKLDVSILDVVNTDPVINVSTAVQQTSWSGFFDVELSYLIEESEFSWSPYLAGSWNFSVSDRGEELVLISRGDRQQVSDEPSGRFSSSFRIPDSGTWDIGISVIWDSGWSADINYGRNVASEFELERLSFAVSVAF